MIRVGLVNVVDQETAAEYIAFTGTSGTANERAERASDWRAANPGRWSDDTPPLVEPTPDPNAAAKAQWKYRTTAEPKYVAVNPIDSRPASEGYDTWNFDVCHPALRR